MVRCQSACEWSTNGLGSGAIPAMLQAQSSPPKESTAHATIASTDASSATSTVHATAAGPI
jgi:hypothetical protein